MIKQSYTELVLAITSTLMHGFQNNLARSNDKTVINRVCLGHNFYIYYWISKYFGKVVHLKHL